ncbi:MAG TPA: signal peptidase I [Solirubrobacterales bacterium]|nr:signal peptidase I [Solirubrobacterales bacterium]
MRRRAPKPAHVAVFAAAAAAGLLATLALTILASLVVGHKLVVIGSSTMEPALSDGDLVIERQVAPGDAEVGDIVTFSEPVTGRSLTRRVEAVAETSGRVGFVTKGDSSPTFERFSLPADGQIGIPTRKVPLAGDLSGLTGLFVLLAFVLLGVAAVALSRRRHRAGP